MIALFFPREAKLIGNEIIQIGARRLREGQSYKFVGDLAETGVDGLETCNALPSSMVVGDAWDATVAGAAEAPVMVASNRGRTTLSPGAITLGRFALEQGCLRFFTAERSYLAVFGSGGTPVISGNGFRYSGRQVVLGKEYQIGGGPRSLEPGTFELDAEIQRSCLGPYFQIGPILNG